jgi:hypothetical protein
VKYQAMILIAKRSTNGTLEIMHPERFNDLKTTYDRS